MGNRKTVNTQVKGNAFSVSFERWVLHPFLFSLFPILLLFTHNIDEVEPVAILRSVLVSLIVTVLLFALFRLIFRDSRKAALLASTVVIINFSYGRVMDFLKPYTIAGINLGRHRVVVLLAVIVILLVVAFCLWNKKAIRPVNAFLNFAALLAIVFPLVQCARYLGSVIQEKAVEDNIEVKRVYSDLLTGSSSAQKPETIPDVYYIILDSYPRADVLYSQMQVDNTEFISELKKRGFYVAECSRSNYATTAQSLASSLNLQFVQDFEKITDSALDNPQTMSLFVNHNQVTDILRHLGYKIYAIESGEGLSEMHSADVYLNFSTTPGWYLLGGINPFESMLLNSTTGRYFFDYYPHRNKNLRMMLDYPYMLHRERILFEFNKVEELAKKPTPKFVFAHILAPHDPFVFNAEGGLVIRTTPFTLNHDLEYLDEDDYIAGYQGEMAYLNQRILAMIDAILENSTTRPVIILQGDHGLPTWLSSPEMRMAILNAFLVPEAVPAQLYSGITPVNTFRVLFDALFAMDFPLKEDIVYYSNYDETHVTYRIVQDSYAECQTP